MRKLRQFLILFSVFAAPTAANAAEIRVAVTTSFHNSGLSSTLLPAIKRDLDVDVRLIVVGTGQALRLGKAGDVDAILVHSKKAEEAFVAEGYGTHRREIMYNDFVIIGPTDDPAKIAATKSAADALKAISSSQSLFVSRGDDSGTNRKELSLWKSIALNTETFPATWYRAVGSGMGATLNAASAMNAYVMSDRASWLNFENKRDLKLIYSGDPVLFNQYSFLPVNPAKHPHVKSDLANTLEQWLTSPQAQKMIAEYRISGETLFTPNARSK